MAPVQKRKRGRLPNAPNSDAATANPPDQIEPDEDESARLRKKGRSVGPKIAPAPEPEPESKQRKSRRGKGPAVANGTEPKTTVMDSTANNNSQGHGRRTRSAGLPHKSGDDHGAHGMPTDTEDLEETRVATKRASKNRRAMEKTRQAVEENGNRRNPSRGGGEAAVEGSLVMQLRHRPTRRFAAAAEEETTENQGNHAAAARRARTANTTRPNAPEAPGPTAGEPANDSAPRRTRSARSQPATSGPDNGKKKTKSRKVPPPRERPAGPGPSATRRRSRPSYSVVQAHASPDIHPATEPLPPREANVRRQQNRIPPPPRRPYRHIEPRVCHVPADIIENDWTPLLAKSVDRIESMFTAAQGPVVGRLPPTGQSRQHAADAVKGFTDRLLRKLRHDIPFPKASAGFGTTAAGRAGRPGGGGEGGSGVERNWDSGRTAELNFDAVVHAVQDLERRLNPLQHSVEILEKTRRDLEEELEVEHRKLHSLQSNARNEMRSLREQLRKAHVLVPEGDDRGGPDRGVADVAGENATAFVADSAFGSLLVDIREDEELRRLAGQVSGHVDSMRGNARQVDGVIPEIEKSTAALRQVLLGHLDEERYEQALFG